MTANRSTHGALCGLVMLLVAASAGADGYVWWEAEAPAKTNFPAETWFSAKTFPDNADRLSGGRWLSNRGKRKGPAAFARYAVRVPAGGAYDLWTRKFWKHGPFTWRFDAGQWATCGRDCALADSVDLKTHVCANWVHLGKVMLTAGRHVFELRLTAGPGEQLTAAFDCFCLVPADTLFVPRGKLKPGERTGRAASGWFAWEPAADAFSDEALLDLRRLNEPTAGRHGFVRRAEKPQDPNDRAALALGNGEPVRFWGVNVSAEVAAGERKAVDFLARKLAKLGVNLVRFHSALFRRDGDVARVDPERLDDLHYLVAALKKQGIYTEISFFYPLWFDIKPDYGIAGYDGFDNKKPFALLFFNERMQAIHRRWLREMLTARNPYTGVRLAREPAVAMIEIINEDSLLFWTFSKKNVPPVHWRALEALFAKWLNKEYGALAKAYAAWGGRRQADTPDRPEVLEAWFMTGDGVRRSGVSRRRIWDQARFLTDLQAGFYQRVRTYIKEALGYGGLVVASNWQTADPAVLDRLERDSYAVCDVLDRHGYFGGQHKGDGAGYCVREGHTYRDRSALTAPGAIPLTLWRGRATLVSELGWPQPNRCRGEACALAAWIGRRTGLDGICWFAVADHSLCDAGMRKFQIGSPAAAGTFPAAALVYRLGCVKARQPAGSIGRSLPQRLLLGTGPADGPAAVPQVPWLLYGVELAAGKPQPTRFDPRLAGDWPRWRRKKRFEADVALWDWKAGFLRYEGDRVMAAVGRLKAAGPVQFAAGSIHCRNEFAGVLVVPLDDKPLADSRRILVQAMTEDRPYGFRAEGGRIESLGTWPWNVRRIDATVALKLAAGPPPEVVPLDENGMPREDRPKVAWTAQGEATFRLADDAVYHVLIRPKG
jgi:hypothetical protein